MVFPVATGGTQDAYEQLGASSALVKVEVARELGVSSESNCEEVDGEVGSLGAG